MDSRSEGLPHVQCVIEKDGRIADHRSPLTVWYMTVICRGENKEKGEEKKEREKKLTVVLLGHSLAGAGLMNEEALIFFFFLLQSTRDGQWPIAINADQPKLLPQQQNDRVWSRRGG